MIDNSPVIDFHGHVGRMDEFLAWDDPELMLHAMDAVGIDQSCVFNVWHPHGTGGNDRTAAFVARHPDRFIGFAYVSPTVPGGMVEELTRAVDELGMRAIKIYPPFGSYPLDHAAWDPIYAFAAERGLAIISHTGGEPTANPADFGRAAARFPGANFVAGHSGNAETYGVICRIAQKIECVSLQCTRFSSEARHDFDAEHNGIENERDPQDTSPQRIIIRLAVFDKTAAIFSHSLDSLYRIALCTL